MRKILRDESSSPKNKIKKNENEIPHELELSNLKSETKTRDN